MDNKENHYLMQVINIMNSIASAGRLATVLVTSLIYGNLAGMTPAQAQTFNPDLEANLKNINPAEVVKWEVLSATSPESGVVEVGLRLLTLSGFSLYEDKVSFTALPGFSSELLKAPQTVVIYDEISASDRPVYTSGDFFIKFVGPHNDQDAKFEVKATFTACTNKICLFPYTETLTVAINYSERENAQVVTVSDPEIEEEAAPATSQPIIKEASPTTKALPFENAWAEKISSGTISFGLLILICFLAGIGTNLTPCVYPMIPITLRLLGRDGHNLAYSTMYALGILVSYTSLGFFAALTGKLFGAIMANPSVNFILFLIMTLLGLSMLGYFNFSKLQALGNKLGAGKASLKNTFLMGTGAGLVASPCTGPILATLLVNSAKSGAVAESTFLIFIYSFGFSLPYILLGSTAGHIKKIKLSNNLQLIAEVVFSSVMFALALYYLRIPAYAYTQQLSGSWLLIAYYTLALALLSLLLIVMIRKLKSFQKILLLPSLLLAFSMFAKYQASTSDSAAKAESTLYFKDEKIAFEFAARHNRYILVDNWAEWCEACKKMDVTTFKDPKLMSFFEQSGQWIFLKLDLTETNADNDAILSKYEIQGLPTLVLLNPQANLDQRENIAGYVDAPTLLKKMQEFAAREK
ncbi:MAG: thioredoxin fold domain-containing protein [Oligoflexales bacterium]|nr:thioredoxin fold domain-containing protein [Oligoflexales bacterium]